MTITRTVAQSTPRPTLELRQHHMSSAQSAGKCCLLTAEGMRGCGNRYKSPCSKSYMFWTLLSYPPPPLLWHTAMLHVCTTTTTVLVKAKWRERGRGSVWVIKTYGACTVCGPHRYQMFLECTFRIGSRIPQYNQCKGMIPKNQPINRLFVCQLRWCNNQQSLYWRVLIYPSKVALQL